VFHKQTSRVNNCQENYNPETKEISTNPLCSILNRTKKILVVQQCLKQKSKYPQNPEPNRSPKKPRIQTHLRKPNG